MAVTTATYSTADVAQLAGVHRDTLLRWLRHGAVREPARDRNGWRVFTFAQANEIAAFARKRAMPDSDSQPSHPDVAARLQTVDWDFASAKTGYLTHGVHPYPAKFIPQIPNALIQELSMVGETIADIFCGSGTTLLEALQLKRNAIGIDANPLATQISKAKTTPLSETAFAEVLEHRAKCEALLSSIEPSVGDLFYGGSPFRSSQWRPSPEVCEFWFLPHVVEELAELRASIAEIRDSAARVLCETCFSAIVVSVSKQDSDTRYVRRDKQISPGDTCRRYLAQLNAGISSVRELTDILEDRFACRVATANVLDAPAVDPFHLLVTSPPYPNAYSYHLYHRTRLIWLGHDPEEFKRIEIGSHRKYSSKGRRRATADTFRLEFRAIFSWLRDFLLPKRYACFVIGDSTLDGARIDNASLIAEAAKPEGFREVARIARNIAATKKAFNPKIGKIRTENILILRKS